MNRLSHRDALAKRDVSVLEKSEIPDYNAVYLDSGNSPKAFSERRSGREANAGMRGDHSNQIPS